MGQIAVRAGWSGSNCYGMGSRVEGDPNTTLALVYKVDEEDGGDFATFQANLLKSSTRTDVPFGVIVARSGLRG